MIRLLGPVQVTLDGQPVTRFESEKGRALLSEEGQAERAVELYALASRYPFVGESQWFEDVTGGQITGLAAGLPEHVVAAARQRGEVRDLMATVEELLSEPGA
jgi:hypothetical protein